MDASSRFSTDPITSNAIMDYSVEEEDPLSLFFCDATHSPRAPSHKKFKTESENERWFSVDKSGTMKFVDNIKDYFSHSSEYPSPTCSDSEPSANCSSSRGSFPTLGAEEPSCSSRQHRRTWSDISATSNIEAAALCPDARHLQSGKGNEARNAKRNNGLHLQLPLQTYEYPPVDLLQFQPPSLLDLEQPGETSPSPVYLQGTKIPVNAWFKACR